jgi:hypothetical protein
MQQVSMPCGQVCSSESRTYDTWTVAAAADQTEVNVCSDMAQMCWAAIPRLYSNGIVENVPQPIDCLAMRQRSI